MDFDTALLRAFVAVQDTGGFTRAAERLHLSHPPSATRSAAWKSKRAARCCCARRAACA